MEEAVATGVAEVRTFLIADVRGYTRFTVEHGDAAAAQLATRFAAITRDIVAARSGEVVELRGDEALAVFVSTRQALFAAAELQQRFGGEADIPVGIGLDAGEALPVEAGFRGAALNMAARLCSLAGPGEVLASETVTSIARKLEGLVYLDRGRVELKGFDEPVGVLQVIAAEDEEATGPLEQPEDATAADLGTRILPIGGFLGSLPVGFLVGRDQELVQLRTAVDEVLGGHGQCVLLTGEPGAGKTRLGQEATLLLHNAGFLIAAGRCYEPQSAVPYYPWVEALTRLVELAPSAIRRQAASRWAYLGRLLPDLVAAQLVPASDAGEQQRLFHAVTGFLQAIAGIVPVALLLDDLHWADQSSLDLFHHIARETRGNRIMLLGTYRDVEVGRHHPLEGALRDLSREGIVQRIDVRRLSDEDTGELIAVTIGDQEVSDEFRELIFRRTEGNPFFVQQVLQELAERGDIFRAGAIWERKKLDQIEVPESIRSVIGQRVSRLSETTQEVLHEASVLGQSFHFDDLLGMTGRAEAELEAALEDVARARLVREIGRDTYSFDHALTQQTLCAELSYRRKRKLHLAAGEAIERLPEHRREARAAELAWHFQQADDVERALEWTLTAGDQAAVVFAHADALAHYRTALELAHELGDQPREARALLGLGAGLRTLAQFDEALEFLERAAQIYATGDPERRRLIIAEIGRVHSDRGSIGDGIRRLEAEIATGDTGVASLGLAELYSVLSRLCFAAGRYRDQLEAATRAAELGRALGDDRILLHAEARRATALSMSGNPAAALAIYEANLPLAERSQDTEAAGLVFNNLAWEYFVRGEFEKNLVFRRRALDVVARSGNVIMTAFQTAMVAQALFYLGQVPEALTLAQKAKESIVAHQSGTRTAYVDFQLAQISLALGRWDEAIPRVNAGLEVARRTRDLQVLSWGMELLADLAEYRGAASDVIPVIESHLSQCREEHSHVPWVLLSLAQAHLVDGNVERAEALLPEALELGEAELEYWVLVTERRLMAAAKALQREWNAADRIFAEAAQLATRGPYGPEQARIYYSWGQTLLEAGDRAGARDKLTAALALYRRFGADFWVDRIERELIEL